MPGIIVVDPITEIIPVTDLDTVQNFLKVYDLETEDREFLERVIDAVTSWLEGPAMLNRRLLARDYAGTFDGDGSTWCYVYDSDGKRLAPINSVTSLVISDVPVNVLPAAKELVVYGGQGKLRLLKTSFTYDYVNVSIQLNAGFSELKLPPEITQGALELIQQKWNNRDKKNLDVVSISALGESVSFRVEDMHQETRAALMQHRLEAFA